MKKASTIQQAISYIGVFLGAGFISGQELWQFFACLACALSLLVRNRWKQRTI